MISLFLCDSTLLLFTLNTNLIEVTQNCIRITKGWERFTCNGDRAVVGWEIIPIAWSQYHAWNWKDNSKSVLFRDTGPCSSLCSPPACHGAWLSRYSIFTEYFSLHTETLNKFNIYSAKIAAQEPCLYLFHSTFLASPSVMEIHQKSLHYLASFHCVPASSGLDSLVSPHVFKKEKEKIRGEWRWSFHHPYLGRWAGRPSLTWRSCLNTNWINRTGLETPGRYYILINCSAKVPLVFITSPHSTEPVKWNMELVSY